MKTNLYLFLALFFIPLLTKAQDISNNETNDYSILKYSPVSLVNVHFPSIQFAYEHNIKEGRSMQYELGSIFLPAGSSTAHDLFTFRVLAEYRWYKAPLSAGQNKFQGIGFRFQKQYLQEVEFREPLLRLTKSHTATGFYYTRGVQWKYNNGMTAEFGAALGVQYYDVSILDIPEGGDESNYYETKPNDFTSFSPFNLVVPMGFVVLKVGYDFKKK